MNLATKITTIRILLTPFFIAFVLYSRWEWALATFIIAAITDGIDGYVARIFKQKTELGTILDPIADKLLILSAFICLSVSRELSASVKPPTYVPIIIISRDAIIVLGVLIIYFIKGKINVRPTNVSKITTFFQMATIVSILLRTAFSPILWNITVGFTIVSGLDYIIIGSRLLNEK